MNEEGISIEMFMLEDMTSYIDLAHCHVVNHSATVLHSNSYYTVVASIFLVHTAFCKAM